GLAVRDDDALRATDAVAVAVVGRPGDGRRAHRIGFAERLAVLAHAADVGNAAVVGGRRHRYAHHRAALAGGAGHGQVARTHHRRGLAVRDDDALRATDAVAVAVVGRPGDGRRAHRI